MVQKNIYVTKTNRESLAVNKYFTDISKNRILNAEEEAELWKRMVENDPRAFEQLICANLKFVISIAKQYQGKGLLLADLISEGNIGLIIAAKKFDATKGFKFISFAVWWIRQSILKAISEQSRIVRLPKNQIIRISQIAKFSACFEQQYERLPGPAEIAEAMDLETIQVDNFLSKTKHTLSLDAEADADSSFVLLDRLGTECMAVEEFIFQDSSAALFETALCFLTIREKRVVYCYLGLNGEEAIGLEEIALKMRLSKERVRQIKSIAFNKLRARAGYLRGKLII